MNDTTPTVTEIRTALIRDTSDFYRRRQPHRTAMRNAPKDDPHFNAIFDAYEGLVAAGCYAEALATVLRIVEQRHPETAADLASLVHEVRESGNDCLEDANADVWAVVEREREAANAAVKQDEAVPAEDDGPACRDCGAWPCARHATDADRAEYAQATGRNEAESGAAR